MPYRQVLSQAKNKKFVHRPVACGAVFLIIEGLGASSEILVSFGLGMVLYAPDGYLFCRYANSREVVYTHSL